MLPHGGRSAGGCNRGHGVAVGYIERAAGDKDRRWGKRVRGAKAQRAGGEVGVDVRAIDGQRAVPVFLRDPTRGQFTNEGGMLRKLQGYGLVLWVFPGQIGSKVHGPDPSGRLGERNDVFVRRLDLGLDL